MTNVIKQIVAGDGYTQKIKMIVKDNERGPQGERGASGAAATITAGQAYSVPATSGPAVINTGTGSNAVFDFYIPRGEVQWGDIAGNITNQADLKEYIDKTDSALQPSDVNYNVMQDLSISSNSSTSVLQLDADKVNLETGATSTKNIPLTVASHEKAGVMNSATFDALSYAANAVDVIMNGMVAINDLPASPTQSELTTAWEEATGSSELLNHAQIFDVDNSKYWTYYTNSEIWYPATADIQGTVATFTNATEGTIKGSTTVGQVYAESNGTGSVNGWDALSAAVADNTANKLNITNLSASDGLTATTTGSGGSRSINIKISDKAVNNKMITASNIAPTADTTAAWKAAFSNTNGVYWTPYNQAGKFTNQPNQYGFLETIISSSEVYQRWHSQAGGNDYVRSGNATGWYGSAGNTGAFRTNVYKGLENSVTTGMITDANVTAAKIASNAVTTAKIADANVTTAKIADSNVTTGKIANNAVTTAKIADSNVTTAKIANSAITAAKLNWTAFNFSYKNPAGVDFTSSATAYARSYPSGWSHSFSAISGGIYEIEAITTYLINQTSATELDFGVEIVSGATEKCHLPSVLLGYQLGLGRIAKAIVQANSSTVSVRAYVTVGGTRQSIRLFSGSIIVRRVA